MAQFTLDGVTYSRFRDIPGAVYTRSGVEYQQNAAGVWTPFDDDTPPVSAGVGVDVWEGATNLLRQSQAFDNSPWNKVGAVVTADQAFAPDGTQTADLFTFSANFQYINQTVTSASGVVHTAFILVKAGTLTGVTIFLGDAPAVNGVQVSFNLTTGVAGTPTIVGAGANASASMLSVVGGWYLCAISGSYTGTAMTLTVNNGPRGAGTLYVWGAQLGPSSVITPYIPTTNAAATRGNPSMYINAPGLLVPPFTVQVWAQLPALDGVARALVQIDDGSNTNRIFLQRSSGNAASMGTAGGSGGVPTAFSGKTGARLLKMAARVRSTELALACDGAAPNSASGVTLPPNLSRVLLGGNASAQFYPNGAIQRFQIINRDVTDAELQALTA